MSLHKGVSRSSRLTLPLGIVGIVGALAACSANQSTPAAPISGVTQRQVDPSGATLMQPRDQAAMGSEPTATAPVSDAQLASLDDAHLVAVILAVSSRAPRLARVEEHRGTDPDLRRFAHELVVSHAEAESRFEQRLSQLGIAPSSSPVSDQARMEVERGLAPLRTADGNDLDRVYLDEQVQELTSAFALVVHAEAHVTQPELSRVIDGLRATLERNAHQARDTRDALTSQPRALAQSPRR